MTFYAKPTNRPFALEGWFEKPKNRLFGHVRVNTEKSLKKFIFRYQYLVEIYSVSAEKIISDAFSYSENV